MGRLPAVARRITRRRAVSLAGVEFIEATGEVCDSACRGAGHLDRVRTSAIGAGLGYRI